MEIDEKRLKHLINNLKSNDESACVEAAFELSGMKDEHVVDELILALQDPKPLVRNYAVFALAEIGNRKSVRSVLGLLNDPDLGVRSRAAWAIGKIGDRDCLLALSEALRDSLEVDAHFCRQLIVALADIGGSESVEMIQTAFQSSIPEVRVVAAEFLGYIGDSRAEAMLVEQLTRESDEEVRAALKAASETIE